MNTYYLNDFNFTTAKKLSSYRKFFSKINKI